MLASQSMTELPRLVFATAASIFAVMVLGLGNLAARAGDLAGARFFESQVRPLLVKHCLECHSADQPKGSLRLDSRDGWRKGGDSGPAIVPGQPDTSLLILAVRYDESVSGMPPTAKLPAKVVQVFEQWVARGAPDPRRAADAASPPADRMASRSHWSFQPIRTAAGIAGADHWSHAPIDRFVFEKQRRAGLRPVADADRYTWLRRVSFDLTGLPPGLPEIEAFLADQAADARQRVVDRLLASPAFGERWARHWLDLACYADTVGSSSMPLRHAWRYRDYTIASFNEDKPLDWFVRQQIAGDLLPADCPQQRRENLIATGFLAIGPWQLAEQDKAQLRMDVVDHQITRIGTMFLGMTLDCARCHDHKFDPIEQRDYYAMAGVFANVHVLRGIWRSNVSGLVTVKLPELPAERLARERATPRHTAALSEAKQKWQDAKQKLREAETLLANLPADDAARDPAAKQVEEARKAASDAEGDWRFLLFHAPDVPKAHAVAQQAILENIRINLRGSAHALGDQVPRGFVDVIGPAQPAIDASSSGRQELVDWLFAPDNPLTARVLANRVWAQLFGRGLVEPVDYFGMGAGDNQPTHPELLDYLARTLQHERWSLKRLLREIVLSRTYGLSSSPRAQATAIDPENRFFWRASPRRLDAEMIRDGMLLVSGRLQNHRGGPAIPLDDRKALRPGDLVNPPTIGGGFQIPEQIRHVRSIYQPVIRSFFHNSLDVLELFDTPSPNHIVGQRVSTTVPTQSLFLLNSPFVREQARQLAEVVLSDSFAETDEQRLEGLWLRALGRPITKEQKDSAIAFLAAASDRQRAWPRLCHGLLVSNAFLFRR